MTTGSPTVSGLAAARHLASDIKLHHSVFALPFAVLAGFMAAATPAIDWPRFGGQLVLIVLAMVFARTVAMLANRLLDHRIDADNPRTARRALPSGRVSRTSALAALIGSAVLFAVVCAGFGVFYGNWWPLGLSVPVLAWLAMYPLLKRFTAWCHLYLGASLALSPLAAALAVEPAALTGQPALWLLAAMVMTWVAGFDVIYALQDVDVDRQQGHHSVPARLGVTGALWVSRLLHVIAVGCLVGAGLLDERLGVLYAAGVVLVATLLAWEHLTVMKWGTTKLALAFFTLNGVISCVLGGLGVVDIVLGN